MRFSALLLASLLVAVALAGCATDNKTTTPTPTTSTPTTSTPTSTTPVTTTPTVTTPTPTIDPTPTITNVKVGSDAAYPPFENTVDGVIVGFDVEVFAEIGNRSGFTVTFENALFDAIIPAIVNGGFDAGMSAFTITDERKQQVDFSVSYYDNELMAAVLSTNSDITKPEDLRGKIVCTQKGTTSVDYLKANTGHTDETLLLLDTFPPCVDAVKLGNAAAMMIDRAAVRDLIGKSNGALKEAFVVPTEEQFGIAVAKGNTALLVAINAALTSMKQDGTLEALREKWNA